MVKIDSTKCIGCGLCVSDCVAENIHLRDGKAECAEPCIQCGHCVAICPSEAVSIPEYDMADVELCDKAPCAFDIDQFLYAIKCRRSIRDYERRPVEREKLERIVQAGRYTATGGNRQACRFVTVQDGLPELKEIIWKGIAEAKEDQTGLPEGALTALKEFSDMRAQGTDFLFRNAPVVMYVAADSAVDAALAAQNMETAAIAQGLGMLYNGFLVYATAMTPAACEWLDVRDRPIAVCMLVGYPRTSFKRTAPRRAADTRWR